MPRLPRIHMEDALYYITCKGDHERQIFNDEKDYQVFYELLKKYKIQYRFRLYAYVCVPNHFHLLVELSRRSEEDSKAGISEIMHGLNSSYTKYLNGKLRRKGHLFRERFKATLVDKRPYLLKLTAYIHLNPQRLNLVTRAQEYPYSSYRYYLDKEIASQDLIKEEKDEVISLLRDGSYQHFVENIIKEQTDLHKHLKKGVLGGRDFKNKVVQALNSQQKEKTEKKRKTNFLEKLGLEKIGIVTLVVIIVSFSIITYLKVSSKSRVRDKEVDLLPLKYQAPEKLQELLNTLDNTEWRIRLVSVSGGPVQTDVIRFYEGKFTSKNMIFRNFLRSEYSLVIGDDNKIVWESTMQRGEKAGASWRGEIVNNRLSGILTIRQKGLVNRDFSFVSVGHKKSE